MVILERREYIYSLNLNNIDIEFPPLNCGKHLIEL